ncbi:MAG: outer membrane beta-barrel protein [Rickettsiella sp.]|nr:outer membrane beta-barrel protein [Rickettsiella sp.]
MLKNVLTTAVLGASALSIMAANAAAPGVYVTGQLGYANTHMSDKTNFAAINKGIKPIPDFKPNSADVTNLSNNGLAGRLAIGYQFNQNFAVEMGYLQLNKKKVDGTVDRLPASISLQQNAIDLVGKGILPIANNVNVYGKLGVAYLTTTIEGKGQVDKLVPATFDLDGTAGVSKHKWAPEAAIGVSYDITPNVSVDTSWTHIQPLGSKRPGNIDFVAVGLGYNFG